MPKTTNQGVARRRKFDIDSALDCAQTVFRSRGCLGANVGDLMAAMGIGAGSFYAAFGSKVGLLDQVLYRHCQARISTARTVLTKSDAHQALSFLVDAVAAELFAYKGSEGCFFVRSGACLHAELRSHWLRYRAALYEAIASACSRVGISADRVSAVAKRVMMILDSMALDAIAGEDARSVVASAHEALLDCWSST